MSFDDLCARSLLPNWWSFIVCLVACSVTKNKSIQYMKCEYKECQKVPGLDGNLKVTKHFRYHSGAPTHADQLWGRW